ncbi:hypothetical protein KM540_gp017 [Western grey kangaroopox virus]|uniref:Uncharacterized protein n=1 Tax=Western grey kangaroopox virus TaxID=1566307 RepID=A0A2C9DSG5_9POXV|nr:hypothetical protein KM540_gp017 [Western grey kangaroopox virus]ATI20948.1 hypothetical protein [Western grey kangaroopox virus]
MLHKIIDFPERFLTEHLSALRQALSPSHLESLQSKGISGTILFGDGPWNEFASDVAQTEMILSDCVVVNEKLRISTWIQPGELVLVACLDSSLRTGFLVSTSLADGSNVLNSRVEEGTLLSVLNDSPLPNMMIMRGGHESVNYPYEAFLMRFGPESRKRRRYQ